MPRVVGHVGRHGRGGECPEGSGLPLSPGRPVWLKLKPKLTLTITVMGGSSERITWGAWGEAVMLEFRYTHPRTGADVEG